MLRELGVSVMLLVASTGVVVSEDAPTGFGAPRSLGVPKAATSDAARSNKSDVPQAPVAPPRPGPRETTRSAAVPDRGKHLPIVMGYQLGANFDDARAAAEGYERTELDGEGFSETHWQKVTIINNRKETIALVPYLRDGVNILVKIYYELVLDPIENYDECLKKYQSFVAEIQSATSDSGKQKINDIVQLPGKVLYMEFTAYARPANPNATDRFQGDATIDEDRVKGVSSCDVEKIYRFRWEGVDRERLCYPGRSGLTPTICE